MKTKIIVIVLFSVILLGSCQKTPEKELVVNKGDSSMMDIISESEKKEDNHNQSQYIIPEQWKEDFNINNGKIQVKVEAEIIAPEINSFPVIEVEPVKFTIDDFYMVEEVFMPNCEYFTEEPPLTKSQLDELIINTEREINDPNSKFNTEVTDEQQYLALLADKQEGIKKWKELYKDAPETVEIEPTIITQEYLNNNELRRVLVKQKDSGLIIGSFFMNANDYQKYRINAMMLYLCYDYENLSQGIVSMDEYTSDTLSILTLTEEEAKEKALKTISDLGITDMDINRCYKGESESGTSYEVFFTKTYKGIPLTYTYNETGSNQGVTESVYSYPWRNERLHLSITDVGVIFMNWISPSKEVETLSSDVQLLAYDTIVENLKSQLEYKYAWIDDESVSGQDVVKRNIYITEIRLGMMRVSIKDTVDRYMVIPVWDFFGYYSNIYPDGYEDVNHLNLDENNEAFFHKGVEAYSLLTINAIDGSIIDRSLGY